MKSENNLEELDMSFKETRLGLIPEHWTIDVIDNALESIIDYRGKTPKKSDSGIKTLSAKSVKNGYIDYDSAYCISKETYDKFMVRGFPKKGDIILTTEAPLGYVAKLNRDDVGLAQRIITLRGKSDTLLNEYLMYYLMSSIGQYQLQSRASGTTVSGIKQSEFRKVLISLPPLHEQKAIVDILSSLDDKIELNNQMNKTLEEMAQALFKRWFVDFEFPNEEGKPYKSSGGEMVESELGMIPKGWDIWSLGNIINLLMGLSPKSDTYNIIGDGAPLLNGAADFNGADIEPTKYTTDPKRICKSGDILFCIRGTIGNVTFADREYCLGRGVAAISPRNNYDLGLVYQTVNRKIEQLKLNAKGSVIVGISKDDINNVKLVLGNKDVRIKYNNLFESIYGRVKLNNEQNTELKNIRDSLLPKLMSGEIRVSDLKS